MKSFKFHWVLVKRYKVSGPGFQEETSHISNFKAFLKLYARHYSAGLEEIQTHTHTQSHTHEHTYTHRQTDTPTHTHTPVSYTHLRDHETPEHKV